MFFTIKFTSGKNAGMITKIECSSEELEEAQAKSACNFELVPAPVSQPDPQVAAGLAAAEAQIALAKAAQRDAEAKLAATLVVDAIRVTPAPAPVQPAADPTIAEQIQAGISKAMAAITAAITPAAKTVPVTSTSKPGDVTTITVLPDGSTKTEVKSAPAAGTSKLPVLDVSKLTSGNITFTSHTGDVHDMNATIDQRIDERNLVSATGAVLISGGVTLATVALLNVGAALLGTAPEQEPVKFN